MKTNLSRRQFQDWQFIRRGGLLYENWGFHNRMPSIETSPRRPDLSLQQHQTRIRHEPINNDSGFFGEMTVGPIMILLKTNLRARFFGRFSRACCPVFRPFGGCGGPVQDPVQKNDRRCFSGVRHFFMTQFPLRCLTTLVFAEPNLQCRQRRLRTRDRHSSIRQANFSLPLQ